MHPMMLKGGKEKQMNELIKVDYTADRPTVSARELHEFLEVSTEYRHWFPRMCEYGFAEGLDFNPFKNDRVQNEGGRLVTRTVDDAQLTIDMAKEICMLQRNEKGKQARQYFIQLEKDWNSPEKVMARALQIADQKLHMLEAQVEEMRPHALLGRAITTADTSILIGDFAKILRQNGVLMGAKRLFIWMRENGYLIKRKGTDWNLPTQRSMEMGLFEIKESVHIDGNGCNRITRTPKLTGKGQEYFVEKFLHQKAG